jgi:hypothetical protein
MYDNDGFYASRLKNEPHDLHWLAYMRSNRDASFALASSDNIMTTHWRH